MLNIFVSRPTWVSSEFRNGLESFLQFIEGHNLKPRTLGTKDYPTKAPLDEIICLMDECVGCIILGYPQIRVEKGLLKETVIPNESNSQLLLPTEWNHIEAGLAYARGLPLLVIHHIGVKRGIFDRGAINSFLYEVDLSNDGWPLLPQISGAFFKWKKDVLCRKVDSKKGNPYEKDEKYLKGHGVLFRVVNNIIEELAYCPTCKLALSEFPPGDNEMLVCSKCDFVAPFRPRMLQEKIKSLNA